MIDIKLIRENRELVKENIKKKFQDEKLPLVDEVFELDKEVREAKLKGDNLRSEKNFTISLEYPGPPVTTVPLWKGTPEDVLKTMIASLGVDAQEAKRMFNNQQYITEEVDSFRLSVSGVSQDEEMSNMIKFQHAYNAAARMITTVDEMIDVIINRMGRVGL